MIFHNMDLEIDLSIAQLRLREIVRFSCCKRIEIVLKLLMRFFIGGGIGIHGGNHGTVWQPWRSYADKPELAARRIEAIGYQVDHQLS
ncbi:hypothetical protein L2E82_34159 [Cichorium intybus]|uniref:Uncharacterized protein n=1 Tax=Cichorium intybus TaxID=13427 RepID=A0ACB9BLQ2_CICIN|nr:hypothetical protein L2E82_34159 [Cichorium intybus]